MKYSLLGSLVEDEHGAFKSMLLLDGKQVELSIETDGEPLDVALQLASAAAQSLHAINREALQIATRDLLETYNDEWNEYDEVQTDGSLKTIVHPSLGPRSSRLGSA